LNFCLAIYFELSTNNNIRNINLTMSRTKEDIVAKPVRSDHVDTYGPWAWIAGFVFAVLITWMMFYIADGFS